MRRLMRISEFAQSGLKPDGDRPDAEAARDDVDSLRSVGAFKDAVSSYRDAVALSGGA